MKNALLLSTLLMAASLSTYASEAQLIKSCRVIIPTEIGTPSTTGKNNEMIIEVLKTDGKISAKVTNIVNGIAGVQHEPNVLIHENKIRDGLSGEVNDEVELSTGEMLINHAIALTEESELGDNNPFTTGLDLKKVKSTISYQIGDQTRFGMVAVVEAHDDKGENLGSFLGGFLVLPCK